MWDDTGLGVAALVVLPLLVAVAVAGSRLASLRHERGLVLAAIRATVQLAVVGAVVAVALRSTLGSMAFVGMVLGGASPTAAAALQLVVLLALLAPASLSILTITELLARSRLPDGRTVGR
jgi:putative ABC transport system permease protein